LPAAASTTAYDGVERMAFNRSAAARFLPLFWTADRDADKALDPDELAIVWGFGDPARRYRADEGFGPDFAAAYAEIAADTSPTAADPGETKRLQAVRLELQQGRPTLVHTDLRDASPADRIVVTEVLKAATLVEQIHARQNGVHGMAAEIPVTDPASRMLLHRNQGPWCEAPGTERDPDCNALARKPKRMSGLYPTDVQQDPKFCETLAARPDQKTLLTPFTVVTTGRDGSLTAVPYHVAYQEEMLGVALALDTAVLAIAADPGEVAFRKYLTAAAKAFRDGSWENADEAWASMNATNSKWYLRIGPDETYFEPCSRKAGFHVSFARINQDSLVWQKKLDPWKNDLEKALAALAGPPYKARTVSFHLPDFIDLVINAGDSRSALGATIGQSLPNWGPVANEGRGRTVAMTNLYTDPDSKAAQRSQVGSLLCPTAMARFPDGAGPQVMSTVLHEAAHNLGPAHEYKVAGKTDDEIFGGPMAAMLEELKSQTAALYFADWLVDKGVLTPEQRDQAHVADVAWAMGHVAQGMYTPEGKPKAYSQLASIQLGALHKAEVFVWNPEAKAANGSDVGCFEVDLAKAPAAIKDLMTTVARIKGAGDLKGAHALREQWVDQDGAWKDHRKVIAERWLRGAKANFVYSVSGL